MPTTNQTSKTPVQPEGIPEMFRRTAQTEPSRPVAVEVKPDHKAKIAAAVKAKAEKVAKPAKIASPAKATKPAKVAKEQIDVGDGETVPTPPRSIVPARFKQAYAAHNNTCGDKLGLALKEHTKAINADGRETIDLAKLAEVAKANGIDVAKYEGLNNGQKRMNVSNRLRGLLKHGTKVVIGKQTFANAEKALAKTEAA